MRVSLGSFLEEITEKTTKNDQHPVLTSSKAGIFLQSDYFNKQVASKDNTGYKIIRRGQFTYRAMSDSGEFFPNMLECTEIGIVSPAYPVFRISKENIVEPKYLKYFFQSDDFQHSISSFAQGSTRTSVKFEKMKTVLINLPSLEEQQKTISILDKVSNLISLRKQQLAKLDQAVKSQFIEWFGDPVENPKGFPLRRIEDFADVLTGATPSRTVDGYYGGDIPWVKTGEIEGLIKSTEENITYKALQETNCKILPIGTVMVAMYGQGKTRGTSGILQIEAATNQACAAILPCDKLNPIFLHQFLVNEYDRLRGMGRGAQQANLNLSMIKNYPIMDVPHPLQEQFAVFVRQSDKSKFAIRQSLDKLELLKKSLMQQYFG